jgi:hypothetical protein
MTNVVLDMSMSLDGFVARPDDSRPGIAHRAQAKATCALRSRPLRTTGKSLA